MYSLCGDVTENVGGQECGISRAIPRNICVDNGKVAEADYASATLFESKLVEKSKLSKFDPEKIFMFPEIQDIVDSSEANKEGSLNQGLTQTLLQGKPSYTFKTAMDADQLRRAMSFNDQIVRVREFDSNGFAWGTKIGTDSKGFLAKMFTVGNKAATGQAIEAGIATTKITFLSVEEYFKACNYVKLPNGTSSIVSMLDVKIKKISAVSNAVTYGLYIPNGNLTGDYKITDADILDAIAGVTFTAKSGASFATDLDITSVARSGENLVITYDSTDWGALTSGAQFKLFPPAPEDLDAAGAPGTELLSEVFTK